MLWDACCFCLFVHLRCRHVQQLTGICYQGWDGAYKGLGCTALHLLELCAASAGRHFKSASVACARRASHFLSAIMEQEQEEVDYMSDQDDVISLGEAEPAFEFSASETPAAQPAPVSSSVKLEGEPRQPLNQQAQVQRQPALASAPSPAVSLPPNADVKLGRLGPSGAPLPLSLPKLPASLPQRPPAGVLAATPAISPRPALSSARSLSHDHRPPPESSGSSVRRLRARSPTPPLSSSRQSELPPLPEGWTTLRSQTDGSTYYYHPGLDKSQWDRPVAERSRSDRAERYQEPLSAATADSSHDRYRGTRRQERSPPYESHRPDRSTAPTTRPYDDEIVRERKDSLVRSSRYRSRSPPAQSSHSREQPSRSAGPIYETDRYQERPTSSRKEDYRQPGIERERYAVRSEHEIVRSSAAESRTNESSRQSWLLAIACASRSFNRLILLSSS